MYCLPNREKVRSAAGDAPAKAFNGGFMTSAAENLTAMHRLAKRWRVVVALAAASIFIVGVALSLRSNNFSTDAIHLRPAIILFAVLSPASLALAGLSLQLTAQAVGRRIGFRDAFVICAASRIAEMLPAPGGAVVRGGALIRAGAGLEESAWALSLTAGLTLSMVVAAGGAPLILAGNAFGYLLFAAGLAGALATSWWLYRRAGAMLVLKMAGLRIFILAFSAAHIAVAFAVIGYHANLIDAVLFVTSTSVGSLVAIVPAGLGVSEALAAMLAGLIAVPAGAAFLAVAVSRLAALAFSGTVALYAMALGLSGGAVRR